MSPDEMAAALGRPTRAGRAWLCLCPAHDDHDPSLSITERDGKLLFVCRAGCDQNSVIEALKLRGLWSPEVSARKEIVATYNYRDEHGALRYQVVRYAPKDFRQRRPNGSPDGFIWNMHGVEPLPYRLPELLSDTEARVFVCEGEKDCDRLAELGFVTTCNHGGAGKWRTEISPWLKGRDVVLLPDNDDAGRKHMRDVARKLTGIAKTVHTLELPGLPDKGDVSDWIASGGTATALDALVADALADAKATAPWTLSRPSDWVGRDVGPRVFVMEDWLPLGEYVSLYGVAGARKTDFIIQALMASSSGLPFCGFPMGHYVTLGLFCEDTEEELIRRIDRIAEFYGRTRGDFTGFFWASLVGCDDPEFVNFNFGKLAVQDAFRLFERQISESGAGIAALDTIADFFGGEEINRRQVSQFLRLLNGCCFRNRCMIIGSRHPSRSGRSSGTFESGSTGWEGKERARLHLRDPAQDQDDEPKHQQHSNKRILTRAKCNYAMPGEEIELIFEDGGFKRAGETTTPRGKVRDLAANTKFVELLQKTRKQGRYVHDASNNPGRYAPKVFAADPDSGGFSKPEFERAMNRLFSEERIRLIRNSHENRHEIIEV
jgi:RecA-family ATPase